MIDFVTLNQDFQKFVAIVSETISHHLGHHEEGVYNSEDILKLKPIHGNHTNIEQALGDIVSSIR